MPRSERAERITWVYYVSRNSELGVMRPKCRLWGARPTRVRIGNQVTWVAGNTDDPCYLGEHLPDDIMGWFGVVPDTDLELIRAAQHPTKKMLEGARAARAQQK